MTFKQTAEQTGTAPVDDLDHLESIWLSGEFPDISRFLQSATDSGPEISRNLVELDLEYRWKRYCRGNSVAQHDHFGFPLFPRLEDYAALLDESQRAQLLVPQLLAEEYRVRQFWGDQPDREQYLKRFPQQSPAVEAALSKIDMEFVIEGMAPLA